MTERLNSLRTQVTSDKARIQAEMASLEASTDPFVSAVRATRMPMIITSPRLPDNPVIFTNNAFCRLTGYSRSEILGRNCRFLQGPETDPETIKRIRAAVDAVESIEIDIRNHRKDGTPFWNRLLLAPVWDASGELAYFFASQVDVTLERERLAGLESHNAALLAALSDRLRSLEESEGRLRFATQAGGLGIWELDLPTGTLTASALCKAHFGRAPEAPLGEATIRRAIHPEDRPAVEAAMAESVATGQDYAVECRVLRPDGGTGWVAMRAQLLRAVDGTPLRLAGTTQDITRRRHAERHDRALLELDDRFRGLDAPADIAFAAAEILGRTLAVSRAGYGTIDPVAETITIERDYTAPGIPSLAGILNFRDYGRYIEDLKRGETVVFADAATDPRTDPEALRAAAAVAAINMPITEAGDMVALLYLTHAAPREWLPEELAFVREVSQRTRMAVARRRAEQDLRALAGELESQVAARTRTLMETEAALRQSQKMEAVGQLTGGIAHDFNNLLTGISGSLELIRTRIAQGRMADVERYVTAARGAASRAAALTHRLLAFSRRQTLDPKPVNINQLIRGMAELIGRTVGPAIQLQVTEEPQLWTTLVDPNQLENALLNLCINARDAMPDGGRLTIETRNISLAGEAAWDRFRNSASPLRRAGDASALMSPSGALCRCERRHQRVCGRG
ncbi:MAG: PAS domain-containing protein [Acetobacteraceae bacterium]|nr:MAG: PAS domain-containing protein [Acetobacteraceae bacterium]